MQQKLEMIHLTQLLEEDSPKSRLDLAAFDIASIHYPDLTVEPFLDQLNDLASHLGDRLRNFNDGRDFVETAERYLFGELGFRGNEEDYFDARNSCFNQVLERRTGIPITLSVLYMEIGRRLAMPVFGIGLPRHFIVQFDDGNFAAYIDPFHGGRMVTPQECFALAGSTVADPVLLRRASKKQIAMRMLQNLYETYRRQRDWIHAVRVMDLLMVGAPEIAGMHKRRGLLLLELKRFQAARRDLEHYLALEPDAIDREEILKRLEGIHHWLAKVN
jgi:regulator of sirC expression with transglutaminase-like and TPR domain